VASLAQVQMWWPTPGVTLNGVQPFKALVPDRNVNSYTMYWQVDNGASNEMTTNRKSAPHKEASVDVSSWTWHGSGPYVLTFSAKDSSGALIAATSFPIYVDNGQSAAPAPSTTSTAPSSTTVTPTPTTSTTAGTTFYLDPNSDAARQATKWRTSDPANAALMDVLAKVPDCLVAW
jgi:hypothetical protein